VFSKDAIFVSCAIQWWFAQQRFNLEALAPKSPIPSKLPCEIIFCFTKLPILQFFDEFSNAEK